MGRDESDLNVIQGKVLPLSINEHGRIIKVDVSADLAPSLASKNVSVECLSDNVNRQLSFNYSVQNGIRNRVFGLGTGIVRARVYAGIKRGSAVPVWSRFRGPVDFGVISQRKFVDPDNAVGFKMPGRSLSGIFPRDSDFNRASQTEFSQAPNIRIDVGPQLPNGDIGNDQKGDNESDGLSHPNNDLRKKLIGGAAMTAAQR